MKSEAPSVPLTLAAKFAILSGGLILLTGFFARGYFSRQVSLTLQSRLIEKATFLKDVYSTTIFTALKTNDDVILSDTIDPLIKDQEITSIIIVDSTGEVRYHPDASKIATVTDDPEIQKALEKGEQQIFPITNTGGPGYSIVSPFLMKNVPPQGAVRIDLTTMRTKERIEKIMRNYFMSIFGAISFGMGLAFFYFQKWLLSPLSAIRKLIDDVKPSPAMDPNLPEPPDEYGQILHSVNQLIVRTKSELGAAAGATHERATGELLWIYQLRTILMPQSRLIISDKNNMIIADTGVVHFVPVGKHLLDTIGETPLAQLVMQALEREGERIEGTVEFQEETHRAVVYSVPSGQSVAVKTFIALVPNQGVSSESLLPKEAV